MSNIYEVTILSSEETTAPPSLPVLKIAAVDEEVFLSIDEYEETNKSSSSRVIANIAVNVDDLLTAIVAASPEAGLIVQKTAGLYSNG